MLKGHTSPFSNSGRKADKSMQLLCLCSKPKFKYMNSVIMLKNYLSGHGHSMTEAVLSRR